MTRRNPNFSRLSSNYLFPEINRRRIAFLGQNPGAKLISLGIGDTTEPITPSVCTALSKAAGDLGTKEGYRGYGLNQGDASLRSQIAKTLYENKISAEDIFISDGAKCDIGRLQQLFGPNVSIAVQDPAYPVYIDGSFIVGVREILYIPCVPENNFWPDWSKFPRTDLIYCCSPNNPTGAAASYQQLQQLVQMAKANRSVILFDAAYANYIQGDFPRSIYEIEGAQEVAIEIGSFSKLAGFSGIRLGWTIVPEALKYSDGSSIKNDWKRVNTTIYGGASNIAQQGGLAVMQPKGMEEIKHLIHFYLENAQIIATALKKKGYEVFGGKHAPYVWVKFPGMSSWEAFQMVMEKANLITTPGSGFGSQGEGFLRMSTFGTRTDIQEAAKRIQNI